MPQDVLAAIAFEAPAVEWRGPTPYVFAAIPTDLVGEIRWAARAASYGWGCVPVAAEADGIAFRTTLFPKDGGYMLPLKKAVRDAAGLAPGDVVRVRLTVSALA